MVQHFIALGPALLTLAFFLIGVLNWPTDKNWARQIACVAVLALTARYLTWRFTATVLPQPSDSGIEFYWVWFVFVIECLAVIEVAPFILTMSRYVDRTAEADRLQAKLFSRNADDLPTVDVFIPTYNEPPSVLSRTIIGTRALDYPRDKLRIYVLDDGRRDWLRELCAEKHVAYLTRADNAHAKAGNINNGLRISSGDFVAVFDADFVPYRQFLRRTLGFFLDPTIGIVQTPQHFFNKDPVQSNLWLEQYWPDEQRLFFDELAPSRDAWNVSFCCGSCSVLRRKALDAISGIPTESVTEDLLTTLACLNKGYITRYLNERLSMGLAAEDLEGFFIQRSRWCRGGIQSMFLANGPIFGPGLTLFQRFMFLPLSWLLQYFVRFVGLIIPAVFLLTGLAPLLFTSTDDILYYQLPVLLAYFLFVRWIAPNRYLPILSSAVSVFTTFRMLPTVIASLIKPFGEPFRVTPKGREGKVGLDSFTFSCIAAMIAATAIGLAINVMPELSVAGRSGFSLVGSVWGGVNILVLVLAALICFETPRIMSARFAADEAARLIVGGDIFAARLVRISLDESIVQVAADLISRGGEDAILELSDAAPFPARIKAAARVGDNIELTLVHGQLPSETHDQMIVKLYTGSYSTKIEGMRFGSIIGGLWMRLVGKEGRPA